ncbi:MAG: ATP-binding protein [Verrucomicrobiaceae bacterium]|nr:MAG: ATP-binding protein [Verrucomicrobiaceae bacterium]
MSKMQSKVPIKLDSELLKEITSKERTGEPTITRLQTDDRVLARVSDGIYRQPASALRELVANAYDADATEVIVQTDAPRFESISVRDNGVGMTKEALVHLINHIGGSAKRSWVGADVGVTSSSDPSRSPSGRRLIGKIGIGLFSVSQLSRTFTIITKRAKTNYRLIADVHLRTYSEDAPPSGANRPQSKSAGVGKDDAKFETGSVTIRSVLADDVEYHGTEIILQKLQPAARDMLRSREIWDRVNATTEDEAEVFGQAFSPPKYHIGEVDPKTDTIVKNTENLPWDKKDSPDERFRKLHDAVIAEAAETVAKPRLSSTLDRYLQTIWTLSLAAPLAYLDEKHPFDLSDADDPRFFQLSNAPKGQASELVLSDSRKTPRAALGLSAPGSEAKKIGFDVYVDKVKLARPLAFNGLPGSSRSEKEPNKRPLMFVGKFEASLEKIPEDVAGGRELSFEAYFLWTPKVVPTDHNGVLIRINEASGTLFDDSFIGYQVAELTRLSQITAEVFVHRGLDAALNIDRESFNFGHPHAKIVTLWVHRALRQIATTQKRIAKGARDVRRTAVGLKQRAQVAKIVESALDQAGVDETPSVEIITPSSQRELFEQRKKGVLAFNREIVLANIPDAIRHTVVDQQRRSNFEEKLKAAAQLLEAYGLLSQIPYEEQQKLLNGLALIFWDYK